MALATLLAAWSVFRIATAAPFGFAGPDANSATAATGSSAIASIPRMSEPPSEGERFAGASNTFVVDQRPQAARSFPSGRRVIGAGATKVTSTPHPFSLAVAPSGNPPTIAVEQRMGARQKAPPRAMSPPPSSPSSGLPRWSGDAWLVLRDGNGRLLPSGSLGPALGASQVGAILKYRLARPSALDTQFYLRGVSAFAGFPEQDVAAGLAVRIAPRTPVRLHGELRASRRADETSLRPAVFITGGIDDVPLGGAASLRGYAQTGYVGGREATAFVDGHLVAERRVAPAGHGAVSVGGAVWGGAQRGARRIDIGPSASVRLPLAIGSGRLAVDYRLRVAGNAAPASGAALTLVAGF